MHCCRRSIHAVLGIAAFTFAAVLGVVVNAASGQSGAGTRKASLPLATPAYQSPVPGQPPAYAGEDTCLTCHADMTRGYHDSAHGRQANARTPVANRGCESCHGPGGAHVEDPAGNPMRRFRQIEPGEVNDTCLTCHRRGDHALWDGSPHDARNLSCITCHSVHDPKSGERPRMGYGRDPSTRPDAGSVRTVGTAQLVAASELELCGQCHREKVVKLDRSGHMPVREGKMQCSTCHNPHGGTNVRLLRGGHSPTEACTQCHSDKRGPFLWEHPPVTESCASCHDPHGSANERMLVAKLPMLCQRCHIHTRHPSTIYDAAVIGTSNRLYARSCVTCHSNVHGSNHASGNMFVR